MNDTYEGLRERLATGLELLPDKPEESPDSTLRALWHTAAGNPKSAAAALHGELPELTAGAASQALERLIARRLAGEPLAHITGRQQFMGLEMLSGPQALIPRVETELLARTAIELLQQHGGHQPARVIDVCTGSGNLAFAIAHHVPDAKVFGADLSVDAIAFAERNGIHLGLQSRVQFLHGDLLAPFETPEFLGHVDLVVSNPPYIASAKVSEADLNRADLVLCAPPYIHSTKVERMAGEIADHEPRLAFDGGPFGVTILMRLIEDAPRFLRANGWLALEVGLGQGPALTKRLQRDAAYQEVRTVADGNGVTRVILACRS